MEYNNTIIINCTISNVTEKNPFYEGFEYGNTTDKIRFMYYDVEANNFFKANTILPNENILTESNKSKEICPDENENDNEATITSIYHKKNSGLSTGGIIAIIIPCAAILFAVILATCLIPKGQAVDLKEPSLSNVKLKVNP